MALNMKLFKVESKFLKNNKWDAQLSYSEAEQLGYVIAFSQSQVSDWIYELRGTSYNEVVEKVSTLKRKAKTKEGNIKEIKKQILDYIFLDELIQVDFSSAKDFDRATKGFKVNGIEYKYLTSKGSSTITFIREDLYDVIAGRLNANRDVVNVKQFASKLSAYKSLSFTSSVPVTSPKNVIVIKDCEVEFQAEYLWVGESIEYRNEMVTRDINDGCYFISPELAEQWSKDLGLEKIASAYQVRNLWTKGILFPVDYKKYCVEHGVTTITDVWGTERNILEADVILGESMVKLWSAYDSMESWLDASVSNGYVWRVGKYAHFNQASKWGYTNYQIFLPMQMNSEEVEELLQPNIEYLEDVTCGDYVSTCLYLHGRSHTEESIKRMFSDNDRVEDALGKALMIEPKLLANKSLQYKIKRMLIKTRNDIKLGRLSTNASLCIIVSDPIQLLEHLCGVKNPKGVLKKGEVYSKFHVENGYKEAIAQRNPMLISNNLIKVSIREIDEEYAEYFKYLDDVICVNGVDLMNESLCGFDLDGDTICLHTDEVMLRHKQELPVKCAGISGQKVVVDGDEECIKMARLACGNTIPQIGSIINIASNMYSVRSQFAEGTREYEEMTNRLIHMQKISQSVIDAKKAGTFFETPSHWYKRDEKYFADMSEEERAFNLQLVADKKPYFFRYNYDKLNENYKDFLYRLNIRTVAHWNVTAEEFLELDDYTEEQIKLLEYLGEKCNINLNDNNTMYKITKKAEQMLDGIIYNKEKGDVEDLLKSGEYKKEDYLNLMPKFEQILAEYSREVKKIYSVKTILEKREREQIISEQIEELKLEILHKILVITDFNEKLACDVLIDVTEDTGTESMLLWELFGKVIIDNLLNKNGHKANLIVEDEEGMYNFKGRAYSIKKVEIE